MIPNESLYDQHRKKTCQWCAKGMQYSELEGKHWDGYTDGPTCTAPTEREFAESTARHAAELEVALAKAPHAGNCKFREWDCAQPGCGETHGIPCDCYLSSLPDAVSRGRQLLEMERELKELRGSK